MRRAPVDRLAIAGTALLLAACSADQRTPIDIVYPFAAVGRQCPTSGDNRIPRTPGSVLRFTAYDPSTSPPSFVCDRVLPVAGGGLGLAFPAKSPPLDIDVELFSGPAADAGSPPALLAYGLARNYDPAHAAPLTVALRKVGAFGCAQHPLATARAFHTATLLPNGQVLIVGGLVANPNGATQIGGSPLQLYGTTSIEVYDPGSEQSLPVTVGANRPGSSGLVLPRAFGAAYFVPGESDANNYYVLLLGGISPDPTNPSGAMVTAADPSMPGTQPLRLWPTSSATPANADLLDYNPHTRTVTHQVLGGVFLSRMMGGANRVDYSFATPGVFSAMGPLDAIQLITGVPSPSAMTWLPPEIGGASFTSMSSGYFVPWGPNSTKAVHLGSSVMALTGGAALLWGGDLLGATTAEIATGLPNSGAAIDSCVVGASIPATAYQALVPLDENTTGSTSALLVGGFGVTAGSGGAPGSALTPKPMAPFAQKVTATIPSSLSCSAPPAITAATVAAAGGAPAPVGVGYLDAVRLYDGKVLIAGGSPDPSGCPNGDMSYLCSVSQAYLYDPTDGMLHGLAGGAAGDAGSTAGGLGVDRFGHVMTLLLDGSVLVTGGIQDRKAGDVEVVRAVEQLGERASGSESFTIHGSDGGTVMATRAPGGEAVDTTTGQPAAPCALAQ